LNPYHHLVSQYVRLLNEGRKYPLGEFEPLPRPESAAPHQPKALFFAPHPDDECIIDGLALRLMRESGYNVVNVAVTLGSKKERRAERFRELQDACHYIGFGLVATGPEGLEGINPKTRDQDRAHWAKVVEVIAKILAEHQPKVLFFPHDQDWNSTHIGTHFLVMDALKLLGTGLQCQLVETEFWGQMDTPNLMVEIDANDLGDLMTATSFHVGEVRRNPYHLLLPAWMMDNVRRGSELVGGQGGGAPEFAFAALYRLRKWSGGQIVERFQGGKLLSRTAPAGDLFIE